MSVAGNEEFTRGCFSKEHLSFLRLFNKKASVGIVFFLFFFPSAYLRLWVGCACCSADPQPFDTSRAPAVPTRVLLPQCASQTGESWAHSSLAGRSCQGNGAAPTGERVRAVHEKFAPGCAAAVAEQLR